MKKKDLTHLADLESDSGNITNSVTLTSETADQHLIVLLDKVQATVIGDEGGDLLAVLDQLHTNALPDGRVRLLGLNADLLEDNSLWKRFVIQNVRRRRSKRREVRLQEANKLLSRDIPNPFLHMNIEELKQHAISLCYRQIKEQMGKGMSYTESRGGAVRDVATIVCVDRSTIFKWLHELDTVGELSRSKRGRHSKAITPIVNPQFRQLCQDQCTSTGRTQPHHTSTGRMGE